MNHTSLRHRFGRWSVGVVALTTALVGGPSWALDLSQALEAALEQDPTIRAVRAATLARQERVPQARAQLMPNVSLSASRNNNDLENTAPNFLGEPATTNSRYVSGNATLTVRQPLFRKYQFADYQQAQSQVDDANAVLERELQNLAVRVSGAYFEALQASEQLALVLAQKTAYSTQLDAARKRFNGGAGTRTDIDEAQAALDLNLAQELEARQNITFTRRQLQMMIGRPVDNLSTVDPSKLELTNPSPDSVDTWVERAEAHSPEIQSLRAQLEAARLEIEKARSGHYPTLDAIAQWSRSESENVTSVNTSYKNRSIGLQFNLPLYSGGYVSSTVRQALAEQERATQALEAMRRDIDIRVHKEFRGVTEGVLKVKALEQAVRSTEQVAISNRRSFEAGSRTLMDTLNAEQQRVSAQRDLAQARLFYLISRVRLHALTGGAKEEAISQINGWLTPTP
ncbi:MAG: TolC family outer membrane protein [Burkholderiales bacterium]|nr:TolC family outer membrane protein [Burkholderiales bacterium]